MTLNIFASPDQWSLTLVALAYIHILSRKQGSQYSDLILQQT
jgi:hypothetical protein